MARIVPKLNLNKTPQIVENNSLIFAKNIKVMKDGSIVTDDGISRITSLSYYLTTGYSIVGYIPYNTCIYFFLYNGTTSTIVKYDETDPNSITSINCNWNYSGGIEHTTKIYGEVIVNLNSDIILVIAEGGNDSLEIPIKFINTNRCSEDDDESIYTQSPKVPIINLLDGGRYTKVIPNGVYQFFIRYEIKEDFYTKWIPCSKELFAGTTVRTDTFQGSVNYININSDATQSFILNVDKISNNFYGYKSFQIGFILSHDDSTVARAWKHFSFDVKKIYFDYDKSYIEEVNIDDMLDSVYQIYNVKNITSFKNKIYISNYKESDINPKDAEFTSKAESIQVNINTSPVNNSNEIKYKNNIINTEVGNDGLELFTYKKNSSHPLYNKSLKELINEGNLVVNNWSAFDYRYTKSRFSLGILYKTEGDKKIPDISKFPEVMHDFYTRNSEVVFFEVIEIKFKIGNTTYTLNDFTDAIYNEYDNLRVSQDSSYYDNPEHINTLPSYNGGVFTNIENKVINFIADFINNSSTFGNNYGDANFKGFGLSGYIYNNNNHKIDEITVKCKYYSFDMMSSISIIRHEDGTYSDAYYPNEKGEYNDATRYSYYDEISQEIKTYTYGQLYEYDGLPMIFRNEQLETLTFTNLINTKYISRTNNRFNYQTLIPFKTYAFYVHYVKESGEVTNGYKICEKLISIPPSIANAGTEEETRTYNTEQIIYPSFANIQFPTGYDACFISIAAVKNNVAQIFEDNCIEIDSLLLPINNNIKAYSLDQLYQHSNNNETYFDTNAIVPEQTLEYLYSGKVKSGFELYFSASGKLILQDVGASGQPASIPNTINGLFIVNENEENQEYISLTKCTPYIKESTYNNFNDLNLLGYLCQVCKPTYNEFNIFVAGSDVYGKTLAGTDNHNINLQNADHDDIQINSTTLYTIYSEFNLNYLSLSAELNTRVFATEETQGTTTVKQKSLLQSFDSLTLADIYELKAMYKDYRRKLFYPVDKDVITIYNNTIRASEVFSDEGVTYILKFEATSYYNVPTNKGYIVNLKAIADKILVHTQDSLFGFSGSSKLNTQDGNAQLSESDPFDTGITELFGSEHGFVGLANKNHTMLCYDGYFFFDKDAKTIYSYNGQGLTLLSDPIERLLNYNELVDVVFANDYYNDRFFMALKYKRRENIEGFDYVTLSFNYKQKTFVSLHDFTFDESFSTKTNCYFIKDNLVYIVDKNSTNYGDPTIKDIDIDDIVFPSGIKIEHDTEQNILRYRRSIIDVIYNDSFELVKTLNSISWVGSDVWDEFNYLTKNTTQQGEIVIEPKFSSPIADLVAEAIRSNKSFVDYIRVYSESCCTELNYIAYSDYYDKSPLNPNDYKYPSYNNGVWTYNYLRNILNNKNTKENGKLISDESSLIYGKYFVVRFVIDGGRKFKLENVIFKVQ